MTRSRLAVVFTVLLAGSLVAVADPPAPDAATITRLVAQLGDEDFARREAAEAELARLGAAALEPLRAACRSPNPEVARRAHDLAGRIGRRVENEAALAPTLVDLAARNAPLDTVLDDLSEQSGYRVLVGGEALPFVAGKKLTLKTGNVPFWTAVLAVCDAADLRIASAGGFVAPGSGPPGPQPNPFERRPQPLRKPEPPRKLVARPDPNPSTSVFLEPRGNRPKRPAAVYGAVLVEAVEIPPAAAVEGTAAALLQVWPEPKLNWQATTGVRVRRATDAAGQLLAAKPGAPAEAPQVVARNNVMIVKNVQGGVVLMNPVPVYPYPTAVTSFTPNARQVVASLTPGAKPAAALTEFAGVVTGTVRTANGPIVALTGLKSGTPTEGSHPAGADLRATLARKNDGKWRLDVELEYDQSRVLPAGGNAVVRPAGRGGLAGFGNHDILGLRVTDAGGNTYALNPTLVRCVPGQGRVTIRCFTIDLIRPDDATGDPDAVMFWGTYQKPVEVPVRLVGVPLAVGK